MGASARQTKHSATVAVLWRGDRALRESVTAENNRLHKIFAALSANGLSPRPVVFAEEFIADVRRELLSCAAALVWVDPLSEGKTRAALDPLLREVAAHGVWVSAHPDTILKMGTKEILYRTRHLGWGADTRIYRTMDALRAEFPPLLAQGAARVLKQNRGNGGQGVWKVEPIAGGRVRVLEGRRGSMPEELRLDAFLRRCEDYFANGGLIVDQPFAPRLPDGMIRCYLCADRVTGFGHQRIKALIPPPPQGPDAPEAQPGPRIMHPASAPEFGALRAKMENQWVPQMMATVGLARVDLPVIWDADFLYGPKDAAGADTHVLCEINVSSVFPVPDDAPADIGRTVAEGLRARNQT